MRTALLLAALLGLLLFPPPSQAAFGIASFSVTATSEDATPDLLAGSHPFAYTVDFTLNTDAEGEPEGDLYGLEVDLPPGLIGNPRSVPRCSGADFEGPSTHCPVNTQVGVLHATTAGLGTLTAPIFNLTPPLGYAAAFGTAVSGRTVVELVSLVGSGPAAHLRISDPVLPTGLGVKGVSQTLWGVPADQGHDSERGPCLEAGGQCPVELAPAPFLTLPPSCGPPLTTTLNVHPAADPAFSATATSTSLGDGGEPQGMTGCEGLPFAPRIEIRPEAAALQPTGLGVDLELPPAEEIPGRSAAALDRLELELPAGLSINPAAAAGLAACSPVQIGLTSAPGVAPARFDTAPPACPGAARIGTLSAETPSLERPLTGSVYLATPVQNPFAAAFALYLVLEDRDSGTLLKVSGQLDPDPATGRLTATIADLPQIPLGEVFLQLFSGPRAILAAPPTCGTYASAAHLVPSSAPAAPTAYLTGNFALSAGPAGSPCPPPERERSAKTSFEAGTVVPTAGLRTPFVARLTRPDTAQHLSSFELDLPPGLLADVGHASTCPDAALLAADSRSAAAQLADPSCPAAAAVGKVNVSAGLGSAPLHLSGAVYLSGPYRAAPLSVTAIVPLAAGPFDLGTIVERMAVHVDARTAALSVHADPLPQIVSGIPLELRSLSLDLDRLGFVRNPTSCDPAAISGTSTSSLGASAPLYQRFQVGACAALRFKPRLALRLSGGLGRNGHPALRVVLRTRPGEAALAAASFTLPAGELLDLHHLRGLCARRLSADDCPRRSHLGEARLWSPFLASPLEGPIYLREPAHRLPGLLANLRSGHVHILLEGHTGTADGHVRVTFPALPDVPLTRSVFAFAEGRQGLFVNSVSRCAHRPPPISAVLSAQDETVRRMSPTVSASCGG